MSERPKFEPSSNFHSVLSDSQVKWVPILSCPANFPPEIFEVAISNLIQHPEYNSTLILRSEVIRESTSDFPEQIPSFQNLRKIRYIHRKLLARRPERDSALEQLCTIYSVFQDGSLASVPNALILTPLLELGESLPYYHPSVSHLAFRYVSSDPPTLQIDASPLPGTLTDMNSRLYRTCLSLLETLHRYGWGAISNYKKRVIHDCLVNREAYQDLYLIMRERHKHLVNTWKEVTDPLKHVFEDIGIATFLILLWKDSFTSHEGSQPEGLTSEPWKAWPRPPGGFLDFGCGNGLLTHILISEGYTGVGIDVRARNSWNHYPSATQAVLNVHAFNPTNDNEAVFSKYLKPGVFIIGNHADELTPWIPVISTLRDASGYISIPCCSWGFDGKYDRSSTMTYPIPNNEFVDGLNLGGDGSHKSSYSMYRIWLATLSLHCGWAVECEVLRIPTTRSWAIVGRKHLDTLSSAQAIQNAEEIITEVKMRGVFRTRKPEGVDNEH